MGIIANKAKCKSCGDIIESKHRHDFVRCGCTAIFVDGGRDYLKRGGVMSLFEDISEFDEENIKKNKEPEPINNIKELEYNPVKSNILNLSHNQYIKSIICANNKYDCPNCEISKYVCDNFENLNITIG